MSAHRLQRWSNINPVPIFESPPLYCFFSKIARMIVGEYRQRSVYKRYNVVGNGPDSVLKTSGCNLTK